MIWRSVGCSRLSGLFTQSVGTAGPDGVRERGSYRLSRLLRLCLSLDCPCSRSARFRHHFTSRSQLRLADLLSLISISCGKGRLVAGLVDLATRHDGPGDPCHFIGHGHARQFCRFPRQKGDQARIDRIGSVLGPADHRGCPITSSCRRYLSPILVMRPRRSLPPLDFWRGVSPSHAAN